MEEFITPLSQGKFISSFTPVVVIRTVDSKEGSIGGRSKGQVQGTG